MELLKHFAPEFAENQMQEKLSSLRMRNIKKYRISIKCWLVLE